MIRVRRRLGLDDQLIGAVEWLPRPLMIAFVPFLSLQAKLWNARSMACVRTIECGVALCCGFGPGNRHAIVGCKSGSIQIFDLASGDCVEEIAGAHEVRVSLVSVGVLSSRTCSF